MKKNYQTKIGDLIDWILDKKIFIISVLFITLIIETICSIYFNFENVNYVKDIVLLLVPGIIISLIIILITYLSDRTIKKQSDVIKYIRTEIIGNVCITKNKTIKNSNILYNIEKIRQNLSYNNKVESSQTILITSMSEQNKDHISDKLAILFASNYKKVLLIDMNRDNELGLFDYISDLNSNNKEEILDLAVKYIKDTEVSRMHKMAGGNSKEDIKNKDISSNANVLIEILKNMYDIIIIDGKPYQKTEENILIAALADISVIIARKNKDKIKDLIKLKFLIENTGSKLKGIILNRKYLKESKDENTLLESGKESIAVSNNFSVQELIDNTKKSNKNKNNINLVFEQESNKIEVKEEQVEEIDEERTEYKDIIENNNVDENKQLHEEFIKQNENLKDVIEQVRNLQTEINYNLLKEDMRQNERNLQSELILNIAKKIEKMIEIQEQKDKKESETSKEIQAISQYLKEIDYSNQFKEMQEMLTNLKDSYLELSNIVRKESQIDGDDDKVVSIKSYNKNKKIRKKKSFKIDDEISYEDLEKTAQYVISLEIDQSNKNSYII